MSQATAMVMVMKKHFQPNITPPAHLLWHHDGLARRVGPWPEIRFERRIEETWFADDPDEGSLASAAATIKPDGWREYLEYFPGPEGEFLRLFLVGRLAALQVTARCPQAVADLIGTPALVPFLAAHQSIRGAPSARWSEINAVHERAGLFGLLEWLGLPASRQTLAILRQISNPDLPLRFLEPLRASLWEPETLWSLQHQGSITGRFLERLCHALAA